MGNDNKEDTFDTFVCVTFCLLHEMFTYRQIRTKIDPPANKKRKQGSDEDASTSSSSRISAADSQLAFMRFHATNEDYNATHAEMVKELVAPMINIVGDMFGSKSYMVDFDNIRYRPATMTKAIDICFKCYFVFGLEYPQPCVSFYQFLNCFFYNIQETETKPLPMHKSVTRLIELAKGTYNIQYLYIPAHSF